MAVRYLIKYMYMKDRIKFNNDIIIGDIPTFKGTKPAMIMEAINMQESSYRSKVYIGATPFDTLAPTIFYMDSVALTKYDGKEVMGLTASIRPILWKTHRFLSTLHDALYTVRVNNLCSKVIITLKSMEINNTFERSIINKGT